MSEAGVIHDIGYQRYTGPRLGRSAVFGALYQHGLRATFGLGRSAKSKIFPWGVASVVLLVAVINAAVRSQTGTLLFDYYQFNDAMSWLVIFFVAIVAPGRGGCPPGPSSSAGVYMPLLRFSYGRSASISVSHDGQR